MVWLSQTATEARGHRRERLTPGGLAPEALESGTEDRRGLAIRFVPRGEERLGVLIEIDVGLVRRRRRAAHHVLQRERALNYDVGETS